MNWPTSTTNSDDFEDGAPGVSRVRPAVFPALSAATQGPGALRAYQPVTAGAGLPAAALAEVPAGQQRRPGAEWLLGLGLRRDAALPRAKAPRAGADEGAPRPQPAPGQAAATDLEQRLAPLRGVSRELVSRGMPPALVSELLAEIVAEFGNQVLESERSARLALVEQLLLRIPIVPLTSPGAALKGAYLVTGPAGSGKSVFMAHLALMAAQQGQSDVVLVNTESSRIGAAAQMNALGAVFGYDVEHIYTPQELRQLATRRGTAALLVETPGWSPRDGADEQRRPWRWQMPGSRVVVCVPATSQPDDLQALLSITREHTESTLAALCKTSETRNVLPALGALALARQPVGMVVPGPNLVEHTHPLDLAEVARAALGVVMPQRKKGRLR